MLARHGLNWLNATELVAYSSDTPSALNTTAATGEVILLDNHHSLVTVTATTTCSPLVSAADSTAPNLKAPFRGVDLGVHRARNSRLIGAAQPTGNFPHSFRRSSGSRPLYRKQRTRRTIRRQHERPKDTC